MANGKNSRRKGHRFERDVACRLRAVYPEARRGLQYQDARACDVEGTPWRVECKRREQLSLYAEFQRALKDGKEMKDERPVILIAKKSGGPITVTLELKTFLALVPEAE